MQTWQLSKFIMDRNMSWRKMPADLVVKSWGSTARKRYHPNAVRRSSLTSNSGARTRPHGRSLRRRESASTCSKTNTHRTTLPAPPRPKVKTTQIIRGASLKASSNLARPQRMSHWVTARASMGSRRAMSGSMLTAARRRLTRRSHTSRPTTAANICTRAT